MEMVSLEPEVTTLATFTMSLGALVDGRSDVEQIFSREMATTVPTSVDKEDAQKQVGFQSPTYNCTNACCALKQRAFPHHDKSVLCRTNGQQFFFQDGKKEKRKAGSPKKGDEKDKSKDKGDCTSVSLIVNKNLNQTSLFVQCPLGFDSWSQ